MPDDTILPPLSNIPSVIPPVPPAQPVPPAPPASNSLENLAGAVKTAGGEIPVAPSIAETAATPPQVPPMAGVPEIPKKSGKKTAMIGALVLLLIIIPVSAYYVTQKTNLMNIFPFAKEYTGTEPAKAGRQDSTSGDVGGGGIRSEGREKVTSSVKLPPPIAQGGAGTIVVSDSFTDSPLAQNTPFFITYSPSTGSKACPNGCTGNPPISIWK